MAEPRPSWLSPEWDGAVAVLSFSHLAADLRVQRQCKLLSEMGHPPLVIGHGDADFMIGAQFMGQKAPRPTLGHRLMTVARQTPAHLGVFAAMLGFWADPGKRRALRLLKEAHPRLIIANDWPALAVAAAAKSAIGARIHYDSHEFATTEFDHRAWWRLVYKPFVQHLERNGVAAADSVSTVGVGLAHALTDLYGLAEPPLVVRNVPDCATAPAAGPTEWPLRLLYHGILIPHRGIEELIASAGHWREPHALTIRGQGAEGYLARLKALAAASPAAGRIRFEPPVPPGEVIAAAAQNADVGVFFPPLETIQQRFMLPNKLFEYIGAGLAVAVSPAPDMVEVVERHGVGLVGRGWSVADIVDAVDGLTEAKVADWKASSRAAAAELTWARESRGLRERIARLLAG